MQTLELTATVGPDGTIVIPTDLAPGEYELVLVIARSNERTVPPDPVFPVHDDGPWPDTVTLPEHDLGPWPEGFTARREEIYGDWGR